VTDSGGALGERLGSDAGGDRAAGGERARLFVALELPAAVREALVEWRSAVLSGRPGLRPAAFEALHATLCFLGWRAASEIPEIAAACEIVADEPVAGLTVREAVWLPARRPRVLAAELEDPAGTLASLQAKLSEALRTGGWYVPEKRPFLAHVTIARVAKGARVRREGAPTPPQVSFRGSTVTLFRSRLGRGGARYEPLRSVELGA
jgi:RNA 2',3'-cyclic 3'-phosphodiesterase